MIGRRRLLKLTGLSALAALPRPARAARDTATLRMDWALSGYQVPFYWAKAQGYYEAEGIDLEIKDGAGSAKAVQLVSAKEDTFALADSLVTATSIAKGMRVRSIFVIVQNGGWAIMSWAAKPMRTPQEMVGRSIAGAADQKPIVELFLAANKLPKDSVTIRAVSVAARNQVFLQNQVDGVMTTVIGSPMDFVVAAREGKGPPIHLMPFSDFGIAAMATGVCAHDDLIASKPDLVRRFMRASGRGLREIVDPARADAATDAAMKLSAAPAGRRESIKEQWLATIPRLHSANTADKPFGWTTEADWQGCVDLLVKTEQMAKPVPTERLYTNDFIEG